jgi:pyruvate kinase
MSVVPPSVRQRPSQTKIVATVGPACDTVEALIDLIRAGVDVFRLNTAHGGRQALTERLERIREASRTLRQPVGVLVDLAGPKMRLGELPGGQLQCIQGQRLRFIRGREPATPSELTTTYAPLVDELSPGDRVMLADGTVSLVVEEKGQDHAECRVVQPGLIRSRQGVNLPGVKLSAPSMDENDRENAVWAAQNGIDFLGLSFVRTANDIVQLKSLLRAEKAETQVIAKIEKPEALEHLRAIVDAADGVMVARGDLGVEIDIARIGVVQKEIVALCNGLHKPVIIATQMLDSMQHSRLPTRAEVTDVANAILDGADACMLSGETAIGENPREAVEMMHRIALATEPLARQRPPHGMAMGSQGVHPITEAVTHIAGELAEELEARLIVVATTSGKTALSLSKNRSFVSTIGVSKCEAALRRMCLYWSVIPLAEAPTTDSSQLLPYVIQWGRAEGALATGDRIILITGTGLSSTAHNSIIVHVVE